MPLQLAMVFEKSGQSLLVLQASPERLHFFGGTGAVSATQPHVLHSGAVPVAPAACPPAHHSPASQRGDVDAGLHAGGLYVLLGG